MEFGEPTETENVTKAHNMEQWFIKGHSKDSRRCFGSACLA